MARNMCSRWPVTSLKTSTSVFNPLELLEGIFAFKSRITVGILGKLEQADRTQNASRWTILDPLRLKAFAPSLERLTATFKGDVLWNFMRPKPANLERVIGGDGGASNDFGAVKNVQGVLAGILVNIDVHACLRNQSDFNTQFFSSFTDRSDCGQFAGFTKSTRNVPPALSGFDAAPDQQDPVLVIADQDAGGRFGVAPGGLTTGRTVRVRAGAVVGNARAAVVAVPDEWHGPQNTGF
jgi:hypothetical protein